MKINGTYVEQKRIEVHIDPTVVIKDIRNFWINSLSDIHVERNRCDYINEKGFWEYWENGHGSGYTYTGRKATKEELQMIESFSKINKLAIQMNQKS